VFNLKTSTVVESCDVTFNKSAPCPCDVFECAGDKEIEESIVDTHKTQISCANMSSNHNFSVYLISGT
jgi:hypothetical protein